MIKIAIAIIYLHALITDKKIFVSIDSNVKLYDKRNKIIKDYII